LNGCNADAIDINVSTDDMNLIDWYAKATELALTPWQKERLPDFKKSLKKREEEIFG